MRWEGAELPVSSSEASDLPHKGEEVCVRAVWKSVLSFQRTAQTQGKGARQRVGKVEDKQLVENGDIVQRSTCTCVISNML